MAYTYGIVLSVVALKFRCHLCKVRFAGMHVILQHIQNSSDWADGDFFEPNNQGLCFTKNIQSRP